MTGQIRTLVVGAGGAGIPFAVRLATDAAREVVLIEAGDTGEHSPEVVDSSTLLAARPGHAASTPYTTWLSPGRSQTVTVGGALGGSTSINGGYFMRATPADFDAWAAYGGPSWRYDAVLPILRAMERDLDVTDSTLHGATGGMPVSRPVLSSPAALAFIEAGRQLGAPLEPDKNARSAPGVGPVPSNIVKGQRISTALAYLGGTASRPDGPPGDTLRPRPEPNVDIRGRTRALRVLFDGDRAVGVETDRGVLDADEIILTAGAIGSAALLLRSGVGPGEQLRELGIPVVAELPVGAVLSNHPNLAVRWRAARSIVDWNAPVAFPAALNTPASAFDPSLPEDPAGDIEILFVERPLEALLTGQRDDGTELDLLVSVQRHEGRGTLSLEDADPDVPPRIDHRYLERNADRRRMRAAVRAAVQLLETPAFADLFVELAELDRSTLADDATLDQWVREHLSTALHFCSTAPMGSVVDGAGRVFGITGLRVADTSILPSAPRRGPSHTAVLIGELIARQMLR